MVRALLVRGMLAGVLAGLLMFGFGKVFGEPQVDRAIAFESAADEAKKAAAVAAGKVVEDEPEIVSRATQASWGLLTGVVVYATAFGGLFALVFAVADRRAVALPARGTSAVLAVAGFVSVYLVPNLKYPANPPAVGEPDTIAMRTALYLTMLGASVAAMVLAATIRRQWAGRVGAWSAALAAALFYGVAVVVVGWLLPVVNEVPNDFPATVLWSFRLDSFGLQAILWATLGLGFGALAERQVAPRWAMRPA